MAIGMRYVASVTDLRGAFVAVALLQPAAPPVSVERLVVALEIETEYRPPVHVSRVRFLAPSDASPGARVGRLPGSTAVDVEPDPAAPGSFNVRIDTNGDGELDDERTALVAPGVPARFVVARRWTNGREAALPYAIELRRTDDRGEEAFAWIPLYRARGRLKVAGCDAMVALLDYDGDGVFDARDSGASTLLLDRNGDGRIAGRDEMFKREATVEYCGASLRLGSVEPDGSAATFIQTPPRPVPPPVRPTLRGTTSH